MEDPKLKKRYRLPAGCSVREVVMRELDGNDEVEAAVMAEQRASSATKGSVAGMIGAEQREAIRLSLCEVDGKPVNADGVPFMAMDRWTMRTMRAINRFFADLNGLPEDELKNAVAGAEVVTVPANDQPPGA